MRLVIDTFEFGAKHTPKFNPISISGYHIREAGSTAIQELAFTLRDGIEYVDWGIRRGLDVDDFAPRLSFFFNAHSDFFEEIAKYRAARRIWYGVMTRALRREESALLGVAVPYANRRLFAHRAAALQQRRAHRAAGARRGAWAARNRCTPIRSMKPGRCPPSSPPPSPCARSKSSLTKAASQIPPTRSAAHTSSKR